jgi:hypothetical protein
MGHFHVDVVACVLNVHLWIEQVYIKTGDVNELMRDIWYN